MFIPYFKYHPSYLQSEQKGNHNISNVYFKLSSELGTVFKTFSKESKILEIGYGSGAFANFCKKNGFNDYTGVDIDDTFKVSNESLYPEYTFITSDAIEFLQTNRHYDIIFMSHVLEHFSSEGANELTQSIYSSLNARGYRINYMPNADHLKATSSRYTDITHQKIYNSQALEQLLLANEVIFSTIKHHNTAPALNPLIIIIHKIINPFFLYLTKLRRYGMGYQFPRIHTAEILSIMKK